MCGCNSNKFAVGQTVLVKDYDDCDMIGGNADTGGIDALDKAEACGEKAKIVKICKSGNLKLSIDGETLQGTFNPEWIDCDCDEDDDEDVEAIKKTNATEVAPNKNMDKIVSFVKNLALSADEKLLRKYSLTDSCGDYTASSRELVIQKLIADNRDYLVEQATAFDAEKKADKANS